MIVAAGLAPAWQQIMLFDHFAPGEVNRARDVHWCGSGKVLNVGIALHLLGGECRTIAPVGGWAEESILREFEGLGIEARWLHSASPTRVCTTILDSMSGSTTELVENALPLALAELEQFQAMFRKEATSADALVLTGSLPEGTPHTFYRDLLERVACPAVLDVRGPELLAALDRRPFLVKPNREELARTVGRTLTNEVELKEAMVELNDRGAEWVVVSQGKNAVWASSRGKFYQFQAPGTETVVNPIGCGDCLAAGIAWATRAGKSPIESICFGIAAAADNLPQLLPARIDPQRVAKFAAKIDWCEVV